MFHLFSLFGVQLGLVVFAFMLWRRTSTPLCLVAYVSFLVQLLLSVATYYLPLTLGATGFEEVESHPWLLQTMLMLGHIGMVAVWVGLISLIIFAYRLNRRDFDTT